MLMKILFDIELLEDDIETLREQFLTIDTSNGVRVDSKDLTEEEFDDWICSWLDMWYSLEYNSDEKSYIITDNSQWKQ